MYLTICVVIILAVLYWYGVKPLSYWKVRGISYLTPWPFLGNSASTIFRQKSMFDQNIDFYNAFPTKRYNGIFQFTKPTLFVRDLDLIKQITVKDFDHFTDHNVIFPEDDTLMSKSLFSLKGQKWRDMRATVSPTFTSSKMRFMFTLMIECAENFVAQIEKRTSSIYIAETKDLFTRCTNDIVASVIFGYSCDSVAEPENKFYLMGKEATTFSAWQTVKFLLLSSSQFLSKLLKLSIVSKNVATFFKNIVKENIEKREKLGIVRPDMIQLLLDARSGRSKANDQVSEPVDEGFAVVQEPNVHNGKLLDGAFLSPEDITAQAFVFFFSGFDAVASLMCFMCYELALNPDVQEKLQEEIDLVLQKCNGKITYNSLLNMKYLDMVVTETLRKWPLGIQMERLCIKDYEIHPVNHDEKPLILEKGTPIIISLSGIHRDSHFYPNPDKFDPERFNDDNKKNIPACAYIPFGSGPRNCIASRFALLEGKTLIFHLLSKFILHVVEKTPIPLVLTKKTITMKPDEGFWLGFKLRK